MENRSILWTISEIYRGEKLEFNEYNESVKNWTKGILDNYRKDAEMTIRYCNELIEYGEKTADSKLLGFGYYHLAMTLYCLNDYDNIFDIVVRAPGEGTELEHAGACMQYTWHHHIKQRQSAGSV